MHGVILLGLPCLLFKQHAQVSTGPWWGCAHHQSRNSLKDPAAYQVRAGSLSAFLVPVGDFSLDVYAALGVVVKIESNAVTVGEEFRSVDELPIPDELEQNF
ncbi:hypothetical protein JCM12107_21420 [Corynebacterium simulans]